MTEVLAACACALPCLIVPLLGLGAWIGLKSGQQARAQAATQTSGLLRLGLVPGADGWHAGEIGGRSVAVKVSPTARVDGSGGARLGTGVSALFSLGVQVPAHVFPNLPRRGNTLDRLYYVGAGRPPEGLPSAVADGLVRWALEVPADRVELGPRDRSTLHAGSQHPHATSLVRVDRPTLEDLPAFRAWLEDCAARVAAMERGVGGSGSGGTP